MNNHLTFMNKITDLLQEGQSEYQQTESEYDKLAKHAVNLATQIKTARDYGYDTTALSLQLQNTQVKLNEIAQKGNQQQTQDKHTTMPSYSNLNVESTPANGLSSSGGTLGLGSLTGIQTSVPVKETEKTYNKEQVKEILKQVVNEEKKKWLDNLPETDFTGTLELTVKIPDLTTYNKKVEVGSIPNVREWGMKNNKMIIEKGTINYPMFIKNREIIDVKKILSNFSFKPFDTDKYLELTDTTRNSLNRTLTDIFNNIVKGVLNVDGFVETVDSMEESEHMFIKYAILKLKSILSYNYENDRLWDIGKGDLKKLNFKVPVHMIHLSSSLESFNNVTPLYKRITNDSVIHKIIEQDFMELTEWSSYYLSVEGQVFKVVLFDKELYIKTSGD